MVEINNKTKHILQLTNKGKEKNQNSYTCDNGRF